MSHASHRLIVGAYYIHDPRGPRRTPPCALDVSVILSTARSVLMSVEDSGPGIPLDQQDRIFEQFHQVDSSITKAKGWIGLGLAISKQIVEMSTTRTARIALR